MIYYHDNVYNKIKTDTNELFKWLILEQAQAGLSWQTILNKEEGYDQFFGNYDIKRLANFDFESECERMKNFNIIKNKLKLKSIISNANIVVELEKSINFYDYLKSMLNDKVSVENNIKNIIKQMKKDGFKFIGYEIIKSFYESVGLIEGHEKSCTFYDKLGE